MIDVGRYRNMSKLQKCFVDTSKWYADGLLLLLFLGCGVYTSVSNKERNVVDFRAALIVCQWRKSTRWLNYLIRYPSAWSLCHSWRLRSLRWKSGEKWRGRHLSQRKIHAVCLRYISSTVAVFLLLAHLSSLMLLVTLSLSSTIQIMVQGTRGTVFLGAVGATVPIEMCSVSVPQPEN